MSALFCSSCEVETEEFEAARQHVIANPGHELSATIDGEGSTLTISMTDDDDWDDDDWDQDPEGGSK